MTNTLIEERLSGADFTLMDSRWVGDNWFWNKGKQGMIFIGLLVQPSVKEQVEALACKQVLKNLTPST